MRLISRIYKWGRGWKRSVVVASIALVVLYLLTPTLLTVEIVPSRPSTLIVLGGAPRSRAAVAAHAFKTYDINRIIISGTGDCEKTRTYLLTNGVPDHLILLECTSSSTYENAVYSKAVLLTNQSTHATIVTHWYHSRRALATFRSVIPNVEFSVLTTQQHLSGSGLPTMKGIRASLMEYFKMAYYVVRYSINPFASARPASSSDLALTTDLQE